MQSKQIYWIFFGALESTLDRATWIEMARNLKSLGWRINLLTSDINTSWIKLQEIDMISIYKPKIYLLGNIIFQIHTIFRILMDYKKIDIVLFHHDSVPILHLLFQIVKKMKNRPLFILDTRTLPMAETTRKEKIRAKFLFWANQLANTSFDGQSVITERLGETLKIPESRTVAVWPSGVNNQTFYPSFLNRREIIEGDTLRLVYLGSITKERGILELCGAVEQLYGFGKNVQLTLVGDGSLTNFISQKYHHSTAIKYLPPVPGPTVPFLLSNFDIGVLPFPDEERFRVSSPIKLFEYLAAGMPVIATRISCHTDVLTHKCVFWADDSSVDALKVAIMNALDSFSTIVEMRMNALKEAEDHSWKKSAENLSNDLFRLLND